MYINRANNNYNKGLSKIVLPEEYKQFLTDPEIIRIVNELP